jgi:hypothetical protein
MESQEICKIVLILVTFLGLYVMRFSMTSDMVCYHSELDAATSRLLSAVLVLCLLNERKIVICVMILLHSAGYFIGICVVDTIPTNL